MFNDGARICNPGVGVLVDGGKGRTPSTWSMRCGVQSRWFLGVGDGEEGDVFSKLQERLVMGYPPEQCFNVVAAVDLYEDFLPNASGPGLLKAIMMDLSMLNWRLVSSFWLKAMNLMLSSKNQDTYKGGFHVLQSSSFSPCKFFRDRCHRIYGPGVRVLQNQSNR